MNTNNRVYAQDLINIIGPCKTEGDNFVCGCPICHPDPNTGRSMSFRDGDNPGAGIIIKQFKCTHTSQEVIDWARKRLGKNRPPKENAPAVTGAQVKPITCAGVDGDASTPSAGDVVKDIKEFLHKSLADAQQLADTLAQEYGLTWADFKSAGCRVVTRQYFRSLERHEPAIAYPVLLHDGKTTRTKSKTLRRFADSHSRMKRHSTHDKNRLPASWTGTQYGLFPTTFTGDVCYIVGGEEKALLLQKLNYAAYCFGNDAKALPVEICKLLLSHFTHFVFLFDQGEGDAEECASGIHAVAFELKIHTATTAICQWPKDRPVGHDPNDEYLKYGEKSLRAILDNPETYRPEKPVIVEGDERALNVQSVLKALALNKTVFSRGKNLVAVDPQSNTINPLAAEVIPEYVSKAVQWMQQNKDGKRVIRTVDMNLSRNVAKRGIFDGIPPIRGVVNYPILRPDGSIHQTHGYDSKTGYWLATQEQWNVPEKPNVTELIKPLQEFPFISTHHQAAFIACMLTLVTRHLIDGNVPAFAIDASRRGTGKGLLGKVASIICTGRDEFPTMILMRDENELSKSLVSMAIIGCNQLYFDNIEGPIQSPILCTLITTGAFTQRILGTNSNTAEMNWCPVVIFNGNNLDFRSDVTRRIILIRMVPNCEQPEQRTFSIPNLAAFVRQQRKPLLENLLAIARHYLQSGRPAVTTTPYGSFEAWTDLVCASIIHAGLPDPNTNEDVQDNVSDPVELGLMQLMNWMRQNQRPWTPGELVKVAGNAGNTELKEALCELANYPDRRMPSAHRLGQILSKFRQHVVDGYMLDFESDRHKRKHWNLKPCGIVRNTFIAAKGENPISKPISSQIGNRIGNPLKEPINTIPHYSADCDPEGDHDPF